MKALRVFGAFALIVTSAISAVASTAPAGATSEVRGWVQLSPTHAPSYRQAAAMAYDAAQGTSVLFGGYTAYSGRSSETWIWDGSDWSLHNDVVHPAARNGAVMGYDPSRDQMILFGGSGDNGLLSDTWLWTGAGWTLLQPEHAPSARYGAAIAYNPTNGELLLFGGVDWTVGYRNDMWAWNGADWVQLSPASVPHARSEHSMAYDATHDTMMLYGGEGAVCTYSCYYTRFGDTWSWNGTTWKHESPETYPSTARLGTSMVFDAPSGRLIMFGGLEQGSETWTWTGSSWLQLSADPALPGRFQASTAYDAARQQVVVFGGQGSSTFRDTWVLGHEQTISFGALSDRGIADPPFAVSATSDSGLPVSFSSDTTGVCTVSGATVTPVAFGTCSIRASQAGSGIFAAATDVVRSFEIAKSLQTIAFANPGERHLDTTTFEIAPTASSGLPVSVTVEPGSSCSISGTTVTVLGLGSCGLRASQTGDASYDAASDVVRTFAITKVPQTIDFPVIAGRSVDDPDFAIAPSASSGLPVAVASETTSTCTVASGVVSIVASGTCRVRATQAGDGYYAAAPDVVHVFTIAPFGGAGAGWFGTCAPASDGTTACWGRNLLAPGQSDLTPASVSGLTDVRAVTVGAQHACSLGRDASVACWGRNSMGQLGTGVRSAISGPVAPIGVAGAQSISAGGNHTCALMGNGSVKCWGSNSYGELGYGTRNAVLAPVTVRNLEGVRAVSAGRSNTCAVLEAGAVRCWGNNSYGQLGDGTTVASTLPVAVAGIDDAVDVTVGAFHVCATRSGGSVVCWGRNSTGQLGNGSKVSSRQPVQVSGITDAVAISAGAAHTCAVLRTGTIDCWGANMTAQLGDGTRTTSSIPSEVAGITGAVSVSAGTSHTCARTEDRSVWCWGLGTFGRLGSGSTTTRFVPTVVSGVS